MPKVAKSAKRDEPFWHFFIYKKITYTTKNISYIYRGKQIWKMNKYRACK